jgi:hypothetical protein
LRLQRSAFDGLASVPAPAVVTEIRKYAKSPGFRAGCSKYVLDAIDRLVTRNDVVPVWQGLLRRRDPNLPHFLLAACRDALIAWERMPRESDTEIEQDLEALATAADALADDIDRHAREIRFCRIPLFVANHLAGLSAPKHAADDPPPRHRFPVLYDKTNAIGPVSVQELLREVAERFRSRDDGWGRHPLRPTKRRDVNAERTFLVKSVVYFLRANGGRPHWDWVARAVAAMTDSEAFDADHARKLASNVHPMFTDPGEELRFYNQHVYAEPPDGDPA